MSVYTTKHGNINVTYNDTDNYGGVKFASEFVNNILAKHAGITYSNCLEWCSGPGFIGYEFLGAGIVNNLTLFDMFQPALDSATITANDSSNSCAGKVTTICGSDISTLTSQYDLIIGNPPFWNPKPGQEQILYNYKLPAGMNPSDRRYTAIFDKYWKTHQNFFSNAAKLLSPNGLIVLVESKDFLGVSGSTIDTFTPMITAGSLKINDTYSSSIDGFDSVYYIEVTHSS
jgi:methylase of polypeptide subunit release factors